MSKETRQTTAQSVATLPSQEAIKPHTAEESLEMQKRLFQRIARRENIVKGYQDEKYSTNSMTGIEEGSEGYPTTVADLEEWKREMAEALRTIWGLEA
jgi:hypothetical protein